MSTDNVATEDRGAIVISATNREGLLYRSNSSAHDEKYSYTSPNLDGYILIRFGQPYYVGSVRLLLLDSENRTYRFYIQTSTDNINWTMAVDMRNEDFNLSSETVFKFTQRLVLFVKIVGTECSFKENEVRFTAI